jgi:uncharacterized membrane protein YedE/YeeE
MPIITAFVVGLVFGIGLIISGMTNPARIIGFLDIFGRWDPSLAFVMIGAIPVAFVGFRLAGARAAPVVEAAFHLPTATAIDWRLAGGSAIFGVGWGLGGFCPGPAITAIGFGLTQPLIFVVAMLAGMALVRYGLPPLQSPTPRPA